MHQSGQLRAQSMQTVQFSDFRAITPRARVAGTSGGLLCGYCTVTAPRVGAGSSVLLARLENIVCRKVIVVALRPMKRPLCGEEKRGRAIRTPPSGPSCPGC